MRIKVRLPDGTTIVTTDLASTYVNDEPLIEFVKAGEASVTLVLAKRQLIICPLCGQPIVVEAPRGVRVLYADSSIETVRCSRCGVEYRIEVIEHG